MLAGDSSKTQWFNPLSELVFEALLRVLEELDAENLERRAGGVVSVVPAGFVFVSQAAEGRGLDNRAIFGVGVAVKDKRARFNVHAQSIG